MPAKGFRKTHCIRGHEFTTENTFQQANGAQGCKKCSVLRQLKYRDADPEKTRTATKAYDRKRRNNPKRIANTRIRNLRKLGWTLEMYEAKKEEQKNLCAICGMPPTDRDLAADHEHIEPPKPRELLCGLCNVGLGCFKDTPELLVKAAAYVNKYRS